LDAFGIIWIIKKWWLEVRPFTQSRLFLRLFFTFFSLVIGTPLRQPTATCDEVCCVNLGQPGQDSAGWIWVEGFEKMGLRINRHDGHSTFSESRLF